MRIVRWGAIVVTLSLLLLSCSSDDSNPSSSGGNGNGNGSNGDSDINPELVLGVVTLGCPSCQASGEALAQVKETLGDSVAIALCYISNTPAATNFTYYNATPWRLSNVAYGTVFIGGMKVVGNIGGKYNQYMQDIRWVQQNRPASPFDISTNIASVSGDEVEVDIEVTVIDDIPYANKQYLRVFLVEDVNQPWSGTSLDSVYWLIRNSLTPSSGTNFGIYQGELLSLSAVGESADFSYTGQLPNSNVDHMSIIAFVQQDYWDWGSGTVERWVWAIDEIGLNG